MTQTTIKKKNKAQIIPIQEANYREQKKQDYLKQLREKRKIPRPKTSDTYLIINIVTFALVILGCFISYHLFFNRDASEEKFYIRCAISLLFLIIMIIVAVRVKSHFMASIMYRDGLINRLNREISSKKRNTENDDKRLQHLIESTNVCPWNADLKENRFTYIGPQISHLTGISNEIWLEQGSWLNHIIPEDRKIIFNAVRDLRNGGFVTKEYRVRTKNGNILWFRNSFCRANHEEDEQKTKLPTHEGRYIQGFITDITDQRRIEDALRVAKIAAERASKTKSNFLASMSHELRTPLNSIIGFAEIMTRQSLGTLGNPSYIEYAHNIHSSGKHLLDLINDILDYSKIEAGKFDVQKDAYDLRDIFHSCEILLRERAVRAELALQIHSPPKAFMLNVDAKRIKQVLINLLTNAIKFTKAGGKVMLNYRLSDTGEVIIKVSDTGIGIKPEDLDYAFEKFRQVDADSNRYQEGTGLGLSIAKSLVELHDGTLTLESVYGHGTTLTITLPNGCYIHEKERDEDDEFLESLR